MKTDFSTSENNFFVLVETVTEISWGQFFTNDGIIGNEN